MDKIGSASSSNDGFMSATDKGSLDGILAGTVVPPVADYATSAGSAGYATSAGSADYATSAGSAGYANSAGTVAGMFTGTKINVHFYGHYTGSAINTALRDLPKNIWIAANGSCIGATYYHGCLIQAVNVTDSWFSFFGNTITSGGITYRAYNGFSPQSDSMYLTNFHCTTVI
jgi:hypothetical protein